MYSFDLGPDSKDLGLVPCLREQISQHTLAEVIAEPTGFLTNYMVRLRSKCVSKSSWTLKRKINKASTTAAPVMSIAMKAKVVIFLVRGFIIRSMPTGVKSVIPTNKKPAHPSDKYRRAAGLKLFRSCSPPRNGSRPSVRLTSWEALSILGRLLLTS